MLVLPVLLLLSLSLTILHSIAPVTVLSQLTFGLIAISVFLLVSRTDYRLFPNLSWFLYALSILLLLLTLLIGNQSRGVSRWLPLGPVQFQPSEIFKPILVITLASLLSKPKINWSKLFFLLLPLVLIPSILIFLQPDLGSSLILLLTTAGLIFTAGLPLIIVFIASLVIGLSTPLIWHLLRPYQQQRLITFLNPLSDPLKTGYNAIQSMITIGSGQLLGRGLGHGTQSRLSFLPEQHTDFIFASLVEELGFLGGALVICLFALLLWKILQIGHQAADKLGQLICLGVFYLIFFQVFINIGMNLGLLPITGIPLPLLSSGGSSLVATAISLGLVKSVSMRQKAPSVLQIR